MDYLFICSFVNSIKGVLLGYYKGEGELLTTIESLLLFTLLLGFNLEVPFSEAFKVLIVRVLLIFESVWTRSLSLPVIPVLLVFGDLILY